MKELQETVGPLGRLQYVILGRTEEDTDEASNYATPEHLAAVAAMIRILGNAGLEEDGQDADLTEKWILRALKPVQLVGAINACLDAMREGMASEIPAKKENGPVDVTLEEIKKNGTKDG